MTTMTFRALKTATAAAAACALTLTLAACGGTNNGASGGGGDRKGPAVMVVPFSAGGGSDVSGRTIAGGLEKGTGRTFTTENREGGSGAVGYSYFLSQQGNQNTLLASETAILVLPLTQEVKFDYKSFTPIMKLGDDYTTIVVKADSPYKACTDVVNAAKSDRVVAAVSGAASLDEVVFSMIEQNQNVKFDRIPFESGSEVLAALLGGQVGVASLNPSEVLGQLDSGDLRALCTSSEKRYEYKGLADIPTMQEQGIDVTFAQFRGFIAPGGINDATKQYWIDAGKKFAESPEYTAYIKDNLMQANLLYGDDFSKYLDQNNAELTPVLKK
jgi:putative tricarboxylic transport membrane protein